MDLSLTRLKVEIIIFSKSSSSIHLLQKSFYNYFQMFFIIEKYILAIFTCKMAKYRYKNPHILVKIARKQQK